MAIEPHNHANANSTSLPRESSKELKRSSTSLPPLDPVQIQIVLAERKALPGLASHKFAIIGQLIEYIDHAADA